MQLVNLHNIFTVYFQSCQVQSKQLYIFSPYNAGGVCVGKMCWVQRTGHIRTYMTDLSSLEYLNICWQKQGDLTNLTKTQVITDLGTNTSLSWLEWKKILRDVWIYRCISYKFHLFFLEFGFHVCKHIIFPNPCGCSAQMMNRTAVLLLKDVIT